MVKRKRVLGRRYWQHGGLGKGICLRIYSLATKQQNLESCEADCRSDESIECRTVKESKTCVKAQESGGLVVSGIA